MKETVFTVLSNLPIARDVYEMRLSGDISDFSAPGQFINIRLDGFYLRRPISVCDISEEEKALTIIYKTVGAGTKFMSTLKYGASLDLLTALGNGFDTSKSGAHPLVIGGGVGVPPLYGLTKKLVSEGKTPDVIMGFNSEDDVFYAEKFEKILGNTGGKVYLATADGSIGQRGFVTDVIKAQKLTPDSFYTCGPEPMLRALGLYFAGAGIGGQLSFEERMGCGFGACMGCSCETLAGKKRICRDGPVLELSELDFSEKKGG